VRWYGLLSAGRRADRERARTLLAARHPIEPPIQDPPPSPPPRVAEPSPPEGASPPDDPTPAVAQTSTIGCAGCAHSHWVLVQRYPPSRAPPSRAPPSCPPRRLSRRAPSDVPHRMRAAQPGCIPARASRLPNGPTERSGCVATLRRRPTGAFPPQNRPPAGRCIASKFQR
jgi:hypothetical protein